MISERDWIRWRFAFSKLGKPKSFTGISGFSISGFQTENVTIKVKDEEDSIISSAIPEVYNLKSTKKRRKPSKFPSIVGVDFLILSKLALYFDPRNIIAANYHLL